MKKALILIVFICAFLFMPQILFAGKVYVAGVKVNIRSGPGTGFEVVASVRNNAALEKLDTKDNWTKVRLQNGQEGWIFNKFISKTRKNPLEITSADVKKLFIEVNKATGDKYLKSAAVKENGGKLVVRVTDAWQELSEEQKERLVQMMAGGFAVSGCRSGLRENCDGSDYPFISFINEDGEQIAYKTAADVVLLDEEEEGEEEGAGEAGDEEEGEEEEEEETE